MLYCNKLSKNQLRFFKRMKNIKKQSAQYRNKINELSKIWIKIETFNKIGNNTKIKFLKKKLNVYGEIGAIRADYVYSNYDYQFINLLYRMEK